MKNSNLTKKDIIKALTYFFGIIAVFMTALALFQEQLGNWQGAASMIRYVWIPGVLTIVFGIWFLKSDETTITDTVACS